MVRERISRFNKEFKKTLAASIAAAAGLITALAWKDAINEYLVNKITTFSPFHGLLVSALLITLVSVIVIMIISRWNSKK